MRTSVQISKRLWVSGPDSDHDFELFLSQDGNHWHFITRDQANALIVALGGTPPELGRPERGEAAS